MKTNFVIIEFHEVMGKHEISGENQIYASHSARIFLELFRDANFFW
jgi:hypothetical protein